MLADIELRAGRLKRAVTFAKHHQHFVLSPTIDNDVRLFVAIEIRDGDAMRMWIALDGKRRTRRERELALSVSEQHSHRLNAMIGDGYIKVPIAIEIAGSDVRRILSGWKRSTAGLGEV